MNEPVPQRWSAPTPGHPAQGIVRLAPPLPHPAARPQVEPARQGVSPLALAAVALATAVAGAVGATLVVLILGAASIQGLDGIGTSPATGSLAALMATAEPLAAPPSTRIVVDVAGGVSDPGIRSLREGDRVGDAIAAAGGFAPRADLAETARVVNLAMPLVDGMKILVPELGIDPLPAGASGPGDDGLLDLNHADRAELETLPGVGPVTAGRIIDARAERPFDSVQDLRDRGVLGAAVFEQVRDLVRVGGG